MFVDASAFVAILAREPDWEIHARKVERSRNVLTSPVAVWETCLAVARLKGGSLDGAMELVEGFVAGYAIETVPITPEIGALAIEASRRYGRGRHPAALNMGDCFAYACARAHRVPLLYKGDDFSRTDIEAA